MVLRTKVDGQTLKKLGEDLLGYVKFVVDVEKEILSAGGVRHVEGEELLINEGSKQSDLWGGGLDLETGELDFDSMINIRPNQDNPSKEVLNHDLRNKISMIVRRLLK